MEKTVSVIIPIYKVEDYLLRCVDSVLHQTYPALEIILVDDGSPDGCGAICDRYAKQDPRVRVIHKPNGGLSDARNAGLDIATAEYVYFLDSDDWISPDAIAILMAHMDDTVDIVSGHCVDAWMEGDRIVTSDDPLPEDTLWTFDREAAMKDCLLRSRAAWNRIYRRTLFSTIRFPVGRINEDEAIMLHLLDLCHKTIQVGNVTYFYFQRPNSITTSSFSEKKMDWFDNCEVNHRFISEKYPQLLPEMVHRLHLCIVYLLQNMLMSPKRYAQQIGRLRSCLNENYDRMLHNPYSNAAYKKWIRLLKMVLDLKLVWLYRKVFALHLKRGHH